jgi:hypothetical protein
MLEPLWPNQAILPRPSAPGTEPYVRSYIFMRFAIGLLGLALPIVLVFLEPILFDGQPFPRGSLSAYYYSGVRELFVGVLWAIGVFLITYKFPEHSRESRLSSLAGVAVLFVAVFPTQRPGEAVRSTPLQELFGESFVKTVHFVSAGVFIGALAVISYYFGRYGRTRQRLHYGCAIVIALALGLAAFAGITGGPDKGLLYAEVAAVLAFAASWLGKVEFDILFGKVSAAPDTKA